MELHGFFEPILYSTYIRPLSSDGNPDPESESGIRPIFGQFWNPNPDPESVFYSGFRILNW